MKSSTNLRALKYIFRKLSLDIKFNFNFKTAWRPQTFANKEAKTAPTLWQTPANFFSYSRDPSPKFFSVSRMSGQRSTRSDVRANAAAGATTAAVADTAVDVLKDAEKTIRELQAANEKAARAAAAAAKAAQKTAAKAIKDAVAAALADRQEEQPMQQQQPLQPRLPAPKDDDSYEDPTGMLGRIKAMLDASEHRPPVASKAEDPRVTAANAALDTAKAAARSAELRAAVIMSQVSFEAEGGGDRGGDRGGGGGYRGGDRGGGGHRSGDNDDVHYTGHIAAGGAEQYVSEPRAKRASEEAARAPSE